jgi:short-subunit dehydrogenase
MAVAQGAAVITGASSGIGSAYAARLAARGYDLVLVARRRDRLRMLADELSGRHGVASDVIVADVTDKGDLSSLEEFLREREDLGLLVNNAGSGALGSTAEFDAERMEQLIRLNVIALARLSHAALSGFRRRGAGGLINIGSIMAYLPSAMAATYSGTKAFVSNFTRSLQLEYRDSEIVIQLVQPGPVRTEFFEVSQAPAGIFREQHFMNAGDLVEAALRGFDQREAVTTPSLAEIGRWHELEKARTEFLAGAMSGVVAHRYSTDP